MIDAALLRPGRFDHLIYIPPPDEKAREDIFRINIEGNKMPVEEGINFAELSKRT
jgi:transitional endoplasmic reticulum ATPase